MILEKKPLNMYEVKTLLGDLKETEKTEEIKKFLKEFSKIDPEKAQKIKEELIKLDIIKLKEEDLVKIIDILPENAVELNKIFVEISLDAEETNKILQIIKDNS